MKEIADTSGRQPAEALRKEQDLLAAIFENVADGIVACDADGVLTLFNRATREFHGLPQEPIPADQWAEHFDLYLPDGKTLMTREQIPLYRALVEGSVHNVEMVLAPKGRPARRVLANGQAFSDAKGVRLGAVVALHDVTEQRRDEAALRESERRFASAFQSAPYGVGVVAPDGRFLEVNRALCDLLGYSEAELLTRTFADITHPEDVAASRENMRSLLADGGPSSFNMEKRYLHARGHVIYVVMSGAVVRDAQHRLQCAITQVQDITARKLAEEGLRTSMAEFRALTEAMPQIVWLAGTDGRTLYMNQHWVDYTGIPLDESLGTGWNQPLHPDDRPRGWTAWQEGERTGSTFEYESRMRRADGVYRWWLIRGVPMRDAAGVVYRWCGTCTDIHDLKMAETEISRTNRALEAEIIERKRAEVVADAANHAKSEFLANMSHEIRTPLNGVIGMTELMLGTGLTPEQRDYLDMVKTSGESLLALINDILDFSKMEAGQLTIDVIPFDLTGCLATTIKLLGPSARVKSLQLRCDIREGVPAALLGDPGRLRQILTNLVSNAIKFTERGEVVLTAAVEASADADPDVLLRFSVSDTGIGVPAAQLEAIFQPFIQADGSTTREYGGTGLGLAISTNLVALLGGRIWLESEVDRGSTFHFTARFGRQPALAAAVAECPSISPALIRAVPPPRQHLRILLAEDNRINQLVATRLLEKRGHTVVVAGSGRDALAAHASGGFDLILMDVQMPDVNGFDATAIIRAREQASGAHVPIVAMTAHTMAGDEARCLASGMDGYVSKPIQIDLLVAAVDRAVR